MKKACSILEEFDIPYEKKVVSAHRTPNLMADYGQKARKRGLKVIIAGAGGAAHVPGMTAAYTALPVFVVPGNPRTIIGLYTLYSIVQMPTGVPVATVAIGKAGNAGLLAVRMLSMESVAVAKKLEQYHTQMEEESVQKTDNLT